MQRCLTAGLLPETTAGILACTTGITEDTAIRIANATGVPSSFWLNAQAHYEADIARGGRDSSEEHLNG